MDKNSPQETIKNILVVGDEVELTNTLVRHLKREGFCLESSNTEAEARQKTVAAAKLGNNFDLVISDLVTPGNDGLAFIDWLKSSQPTISIMAISGFGDVDLLNGAIRPELDTFCLKPLTPAKVMALIVVIARKRPAKICA